MLSSLVRISWFILVQLSDIEMFSNELRTAAELYAAGISLIEHPDTNKSAKVPVIDGDVVSTTWMY